jgi:hypothetical protein
MSADWGGSDANMLPIVGNFTAELVDGYADELVKWMVTMVGSGKVDEEPNAVMEAIKGSREFRAILDAGVSAAQKQPGGAEKGAVQLTILCLMVGWKLAERRMSQLAAQSVT